MGPSLFASHPQRGGRETRAITGWATTPEADRLKDVVEPGGAQFKLPLPLLWQHDSGQPIGQVTHAKVSKAGIEIVAKIAKGVTAEIDRAWALIKAGLVPGLSIGFKPIEHELITETKGIRFKKWNWLELSCRDHTGECRRPPSPRSDRSTLRSGPRQASKLRVSFNSTRPAPRDHLQT